MSCEVSIRPWTELGPTPRRSSSTPSASGSTPTTPRWDRVCYSAASPDIATCVESSCIELKCIKSYITPQSTPHGPALPRGVQQPRGVPHQARRLLRGDRGRSEVHRAGAGVGQGVLAQGPCGAPQRAVRQGKARMAWYRMDVVGYIDDRVSAIATDGSTICRGLGDTDRIESHDRVSEDLTNLAWSGGYRALVQGTPDVPDGSHARSRKRGAQGRGAPRVGRDYQASPG